MANVAVKGNSLKVLNYLKEIGDANVTAKDIADALGLDAKVINGVVTAGLQRKGYAKRVPGEIEVTSEDGSVLHSPVKFVKLTETGLAYDHEAALAQDAAAAAAEDAE